MTDSVTMGSPRQFNAARAAKVQTLRDAVGVVMRKTGTCARVAEAIAAIGLRRVGIQVALSSREQASLGNYCDQASDKRSTEAGSGSIEFVPSHWGLFRDCNDAGRPTGRDAHA